MGDTTSHNTEADKNNAGQVDPGAGNAGGAGEAGDDFNGNVGDTGNEAGDPNSEDEDVPATE